MRKIQYLIFALIALIFSNCVNRSFELPEKELGIKTQTISFSMEDLEIEGDLKTFEYELTSETIEDGLEIVTLFLHSSTPEIPPEFSINWHFPSDDIYQFWNTGYNTDRVNYYRSGFSSRASKNAPVLCFMNRQNENRFTVACSDALNRLKFDSYIMEEDANFYCSIKFFEEKLPKISEYQVQIRIDRRAKPYYETLGKVSNWWASMDELAPAQTPESSKMPVYSSWYNFHQNLIVEELLKELSIAGEIGLEVVIIDDGWQTLDNKRGYAFTGDWIPERIPQMEAFVDSIHKNGMKILLWYSLPFIGEKSKNFERFKGKYLRSWKDQQTWVLDPRYREVREFIISTYENAITDWKLDGFKLDFIGWFAADKNTDMTASNGRDIASVNEAVDRLMTDIMDRLRKIDPEIMIEFRQPYIGPLMRKYGNMFRAVDCPNMAVVNRVRIANLRLLSGNTAVHSDMIMWHRSDPVENAALQFLNILFSVPQISVKLDSLSDEHKKMITFWTKYWKNNSNVLLDGEFIPESPAALFPKISAYDEQKEIIVLYDNNLAEPFNPAIKNLDIVNATADKSVVLLINENFGKVQVEIFDCMGNILLQKQTVMKKGTYRFDVPMSGLINIKSR